MIVPRNVRLKFLTLCFVLIFLQRNDAKLTSSIELVNIATLRCKKISTKHKVENFRRTFLGTIITDQMSIYEYDCEEDE